MQIEYDLRFTASLIDVLDYIALDSKNRAIEFKSSMQSKIKGLVNMPYRNRKSIYFASENIRDMVFKGYTIVYEIDEINNRIVVMGINKYRELI